MRVRVRLCPNACVSRRMRESWQLCLCETWLDKSVPESVLFIPNYHIIRRDRNQHGVHCYLATRPEVESLRVQRFVVSYKRFTLKGGARHQFINHE